MHPSGGRIGIKALFAITTLLVSVSYGSSFSVSSAFFEKLEKNESKADLLQNLAGKESTVEVQEGSLALSTREGSKRLAWMCTVKDGFVLVFDPREKGWPGDNSITIVLTREDYELVDWLEPGGQAEFQWAEIHEEKSNVLRVVSRLRSGGALIEKFGIRSNGLELIGSEIDANLKLGTFLYD